MKASTIIVTLVTCSMMSCTSFKEITTASTNSPTMGIKRGNVIEVTMKSDNLINRVKVTGIDQNMITGYQKSERADGSVIDLGKKTFNVRDISSVKKRMTNPGKTVGGIVLLSLLVVL